MLLTERLIDGWALFRKGAGAVLGDVHAIFQADSKFAVNGDGGLVAETHSRLERALVAQDKIRPLMSIQADSMSGAMRKPGDFVAGAKAVVGDYLSSSRVH